MIGMCGSGALSLSATQVDRRIKAVAPVVMYDHHRLYAEGFQNSLTDEQRIAFIDERLEQRYLDFESDVPLLTPRDAPIGFDEKTDPIGRGEIHSMWVSSGKFMNERLLVVVHCVIEFGW